jgi:hypothetical protein
LSVGPHFKLIFIAVLALTLISLLVMCVVAVSGSDTDASKNVLDATSTTFKMGFGAIIGLIGGKAVT